MHETQVFSKFKASSNRRLCILPAVALIVLFMNLRVSFATEEPAYEPLPGSQRSLEVPLINKVPDPNAVSSIKSTPVPSIVVDGHINEAIWLQAAASGDFWCSLENKPPTDKTEILVAMDANYLYFGFLIYDSQPEKIQATKTVRDTGTGYDDSIKIQLDTFFNRRDISEFSLNPLGTQNDEIAGGRSSKIEWKGDWLGSATRTDYGWSAEFAIPFAILNYSPENSVFGVNFRRYQSRTKEYSWWADITPRGLPEEMGQLQGLILPSFTSSEKKFWTFMPYVLAGKKIPDKEGDVKDSLVSTGIDIRYQPRSDLTGMVSVNPDFSQVEQAVSDISFSYSEKAIKDNRPFFAEGRGYFAKEDDNSIFYSNRVADFDYGSKGFGRVGNTKFGLLGTSAPKGRYDFVGRALYELNDTHSATATLTATDQTAFDNMLAVGQFSGRRTSGLKYSLDAAISNTRRSKDSELLQGQGNYFRGMLGWQWDYWYLNSDVDQYDANYFPALGLLNEAYPGTRAVSSTAGYYREKSDSFFRAVNGYAGYRNRETKSGQLQQRKWFVGGSIEYKNDIRTSVYIEEGPYRRVTDVPGVFKDTVNQDRYYSTAMDFNTRSNSYSYGLQYDWGRLGGGDYEYAGAYIWCKPVNELYFNLSTAQTESYGIYRQTVIVGSWEITPEDSLGARYIDSNYYDGKGSLRIAYGRKARNGFDIFMVYNKEPYKDAEYSIKLVYTF